MNFQKEKIPQLQLWQFELINGAQSRHIPIKTSISAGKILFLILQKLYFDIHMHVNVCNSLIGFLGNQWKIYMFRKSKNGELFRAVMKSPSVWTVFLSHLSTCYFGLVCEYSQLRFPQIKIQNSPYLQLSLFMNIIERIIIPFQFFDRVVVLIIVHMKKDESQIPVRII